jgi:hypothetical protein
MCWFSDPTSKNYLLIRPRALLSVISIWQMAKVELRIYLKSPVGCERQRVVARLRSSRIRGDTQSVFEDRQTALLFLRF